LCISEASHKRILVGNGWSYERKRCSGGGSGGGGLLQMCTARRDK
jgi:hypothetical protein